MIATLGARLTQGAVYRYCRPSLTIRPQEAAGGWTPRPRKLRLLSVRIAEGTFSVNSTISVGRQLGSMCRRMIRSLDTPMTRAMFVATLSRMAGVKVNNKATTKFSDVKSGQWYTGAVIACIGVICYVLLSNLGTVLSSVSHFLGNFYSILLGAIFAYILNPLANFFDRRVFHKMKKGNTRWYLSVTLGIVTALLAVLLLIGSLIPQLVQSISLFAENYDSYADSLIKVLEGSPLESVINADKLQILSQNALTSIADFVRDNAGKILTAAANSGKGILSTAISLIVAVYLLIDKQGVMNGWWRLMKVIFRKETADGIMNFMQRCDSRLSRETCFSNPAM